MDNDDDGTELQVVLQGNCANFDFFVQEKLYQLLSRLQKMCRDIPSQYQQRISYDLLSQLASSLAQVGLTCDLAEMSTCVPGPDCPDRQDVDGGAASH